MKIQGFRTMAGIDWGVVPLLQYGGSAFLFICLVTLHCKNDWPKPMMRMYYQGKSNAVVSHMIKLFLCKEVILFLVYFPALKGKSSCMVLLCYLYVYACQFLSQFNL
jgi:hypothetical protein